MNTGQAAVTWPSTVGSPHRSLLPRHVAVEADPRTPAAVPMLSEVGVEGLPATLAEVALVLSKIEV